MHACCGTKIEIRVNGMTVNKAFDVFPAAGKILLQTEGFEIDFRNVEVRPLAPPKEKDDGGHIGKNEGPVQPLRLSIALRA